MEFFTRLQDPDEQTLGDALALAGSMVLELMGSADPEVAYAAACADVSLLAAEGELAPRLLFGSPDAATVGRLAPGVVATYLLALREGLLRWATGQPVEVAIDAVGAGAHLADGAAYLLRRAV